MRSFLLSVSLLCCRCVPSNVVDVLSLTATYDPSTGGNVTITVRRDCVGTHPMDTVEMRQGGNVLATQYFGVPDITTALTFPIAPSQGSVSFYFVGGALSQCVETNLDHLTFGHAPEIAMKILVPSATWGPGASEWNTLENAVIASGITADRVAVLVNAGEDYNSPADGWDSTKVTNLKNKGYKVLLYMNLCRDISDDNTCIMEDHPTAHRDALVATINSFESGWSGLDGVFLENSDHSGESTTIINYMNTHINNFEIFHSTSSNAVSEDSTLFGNSTVTVMWDQPHAPDFEDGPFFHGFAPEKSALLLSQRSESDWDSDLRKAHDYGYGWFYASESASTTPSQSYLTDLFTKIVGGRPSATAKDDPHLTNTRGEHFDVLQSGMHTLLQLPRGAPSKDTLMRVEAVTQRLGTQCEDMFIRNLTISGSWTEKFGGALRFRAGSDQMESLNSGMAIGGFDFKTLDELKYDLPPHDMLLMAVPMGRNVTTRLKIKMGPVVALLDWVHSGGEKGLNYLNFGAYHLRKSRVAIGGILGEDSHAFASSRPKQCRRGLRKAAQSVAVVRSPDLGLDDVRLEDAPVGGAWKAVASLDGDDSVM